MHKCRGDFLSKILDFAIFQSGKNEVASKRGKFNPGTYFDNTFYGEEMSFLLQNLSPM